MRMLCTFGLVMAALSLTQAQDLKCAVCEQGISGKFYWMDGASVREKQPVCKPCSQINTTCSACALPVKANFKKLDDGRLLCRHDAATAVLSQQAAERTFADARRDLLHLLAGFGVLPDRNIKLQLVTRQEIDRMRNRNGPGHSKSILMGLTETTVFGKDQFEHSIYVIDGLPPGRFLATCAHEWAHAWIHENVPTDRKLDGNSAEGFCEWVAYRLMTERNETVEQKMILANNYTRGQVDAFIKADQDLRRYDIVKWMKEGVDRRIDAKNTAQVRMVEQQSSPQTPLWHSSAPTPVPDQLTLRGISGNANRRFALINDCTIQKNETAKVRVGNTNVVLRCMQIGADSVVVRVRGSDETTELFLSKKR
jgi:hypothetical protein